MPPQFDDPVLAALIDDLDASARSERDEMVGELAAAYAAELPLHQRLASAVDGPIRVRLAPCPEIEGTLLRVGREHLWVADAHGYWLLVTAEVDALIGLPATGPSEPSNALLPRGLGSALRELIGVGRHVSVLIGDRWFDGPLRVVGADFVEIADLSVPLGRVRACRVWY
jgi:hypothetical protein